MGSTASSTVNSAEVKSFVEQAIASNAVVVFSKTYCPYCAKAKKALADAGAKDVKVFELNAMGSQGAAIQQYIAEKTGRTTVPSVFIDGNPIGGGNETAALHLSGKLTPLLVQAGAVKASN